MLLAFFKKNLKMIIKFKECEKDVEYHERKGLPNRGDNERVTWYGAGGVTGRVGARRVSHQPFPPRERAGALPRFGVKQLNAPS